MFPTASRSSFLFIALVLTASGCLEREGRPPAPCSQHSARWFYHSIAPTELDLLFVVDSSRSMAVHREDLAIALPGLVEALLSGEHEGAFFEPFRSVHVGVVSADLGAAGYPDVDGCGSGPLFGDDAILSTRECLADPSFVTYGSSAELSPSEVATEVRCLTDLRAEGCEVEQTLEAALKALSPASPTSWTIPTYEPPVFFANSVGHADGVNAGFLRPDSILAVVLVTDADDFSVLDPELLDRSSPRFEGDVLSRGVANPEALHPIERYARGLLGLRARPYELFVVAIAGVPPDLLPDPVGTPHDYERILGDPRMQSGLDTSDERRGLPRRSCEGPDLREAEPPVRIVEVMRELERAGASVALASICAPVASDILAALMAQRGSIFGRCLPPWVERRADGSVLCEVSALIPEGTRCEEVEGLEPALDRDGAGLVVEERTVCRLTQRVQTPADRRDAESPEGEGWYYDDFSVAADRECGHWPRLAITALLPTGTEFWARCHRFSPPTAGEPHHAYETCEVDTDCATGRFWERPRLHCDPIERTCGLSCGQDVDCEAAGLPALVCDRRPLEEVDPSRFSGDATPRGFCVHPSCG